MDTSHYLNIGGRVIHYRKWGPLQPKAIVCLVHGLGDHSGRYAFVAEYFSRQGICTYAMDHSGHGKSGGKRGFAKNLRYIFLPFDHLLSKIREENPGLPVLLYGHSMGGGLLLNYLLQKLPSISGLIATSPWIRLSFQPPGWKIFLGRILGLLMPGITLPSDLVVEHISRDPAAVDSYRLDPMVHDKISAGLGRAMLQCEKFLARFRGKMPVPTLVMHGSDDKLTSETASREFSERVGGITFKKWDGAYHELHQEVDKEQFAAFLAEWIFKTVGI
jgi:alpha-beta hydrolase superfamily lysophospholipase